MKDDRNIEDNYEYGYTFVRKISLRMIYKTIGINNKSKVDSSSESSEFCRLHEKMGRLLNVT